MKKLITILTALVGFYSYGQVTYVGSATSAQINGLTVPSGRSALVYDSTLGQYGFENSASLWYWLITEADIDTFAELQAIVADQTLLASSSIDTYSELNTIVADVTLTHNGLIDTFAELDAIVADATLVKSGDNISVFNNDSGYLTSESQTATDITIADAGGIIAATTVEGALQENRTAIDLNTAKVTNATHTGEVTGATALTIASGVVDSDNIVNGTIDETDLDTSVNASLDLADSAVQEGDSPTFATVTSTNIIATSSMGVDAGDGGVFVGVDNGTSGQRQWMRQNPSGDVQFLYQQSADTSPAGTFSEIATINKTGVPSAATDLIDKEYADANYGGGSGDVVGPASATDNAIARFDGPTGKLVQNSGVTIDDSGIIYAPSGFFLGSGTTTATFAGNDLVFNRTDGVSYITQKGNNDLYFRTRNAANTSDVSRLYFDSGANAGDAPITSFESFYINRGNGSKQYASLSRNMIDYEISANAPNTTNYFKGIVGVGETTSAVAAGIASYDDGISAALGLTLFTGNNSAVTPALTINSSQDISIPNGDLTVTGNIATSGDLTVTGGDINSPTSLDINLDTDNNGTESFNIVDGASAVVFSVNESGNITTVGTIAYDNTISGLTATDVKAAIDELAADDVTLNGLISANAGDISDIQAELATVPASSFTFYQYTAAQTVTTNHVLDNAIVELDYNDEDFTINKDSIAAGQAVRIVMNESPDGPANIVEGTDVSILGYTDGITMTGYPSGVTLTRRGTASAPAVFLVTDYFGTIADYTSCLALPLASNGNSELVTTSLGFNASTTTPTAGGSNGNLNLILGTTISTTNPVTTDYCGTTTAVRVTADATNAGDRAQLFLTVTNGVTYEYAVIARAVSASAEARIVQGSGTGTVINHATTSTDWVLFTGTFTANTTGTASTLQFYADNSGAASGNCEYIVSIKAQ